MTCGPHAQRLPGRGWLKTGGRPDNWDNAPRCQDRRGTRCRTAAMPDGRCRMHGVMSTGPRTPEGIKRILASRTIHGGTAKGLSAGAARHAKPCGRCARC
jgi:hypothetical protein